MCALSGWFSGGAVGSLILAENREVVELSGLSLKKLLGELWAFSDEIRKLAGKPSGGCKISADVQSMAEDIIQTPTYTIK